MKPIRIIIKNQKGKIISIREFIPEYTSRRKYKECTQASFDAAICAALRGYGVEIKST
jgi:hypothetical protein